MAVQLKPMYHLDGPEPEPLLSEVCTWCTHLRLSADPDRLGCDAFPSGIPDELWNARSIHDAPYPGDHGITFDPIAGAEPDDPRVRAMVDARRAASRP